MFQHAKIVTFFSILLITLYSNSFAQETNANQSVLIVNSQAGKQIYSFNCPKTFVIDSTQRKGTGDDYWIYKTKAEFDSGGILVQIRSFKKSSENMQKPLLIDVNGYKQDFDSSFKQSEWKIPSKYQHASTTVHNGKVFQHIAYINAGDQKQIGLSIAVNTTGPLKDEDSQMIEKILRSLTFM